MRLALLIVFIAVPLLEIALLIKTGQWLGFWPTLALIVLTAVLGSLMLRWQGLAVMARAGEAIRAGRMPLEPVADGVFLLFAGALLLTPGLVTDAVGLAFLIPKVRRWAGSRLLKAVLKSESLDIEFETEDAGRPHPHASSGSKQGPVIDGKYQPLDDPPNSN